jgi:hypothetical protein
VMSTDLNFKVSTSVLQHSGITNWLRIVGFSVETNKVRITEE